MCSWSARDKAVKRSQLALQRERIANFLVIDKAPRDREGPWKTFARMPTLRSWKTVTGPDLDIPALTFQSWF